MRAVADRHTIICMEDGLLQNRSDFVTLCEENAKKDVVY